MHQRLDAMLQAVRTVRPALEKFYLLLNDEQKARFNALGPDQIQDQQSRRDLTQVCGERASGIGNLPIAQIERTMQPNEAQRAALKELQDATAQAVDLLKSNCPTYQALTPGGPAGSHGATARCDVSGGANRRARAREVLRLAQRRAEGTLQFGCRRAKQQLSWTERRDVQIEYRWGGGDVDKISIWSAPLEADRITRRF
jgi:hypothetical protein